MLKHIFAGFVVVSIAAVSVSAQQNAPQTPPAPAPRGTAATVVTAADLAAALEKSTKANPNMSTAPIQSHDQYRINIVRRGRPAGAIAHGVGTELHYIVEGGGTLVTGPSSGRRPARPPARSPASREA